MMLYRDIIKNIQSSSLSLADLQSITQVSLPTLRKAVQELSDNHWIQIVGQAEANGGRPAKLFGLDDSHYVVLGIHIQLPGVHMILSDLKGEVLDEIEIFEQVQPMPEQVIQSIVDYATDIQQRFGERQFLGVGIAAPGFTDLVTGNIISIGRVTGWQNFPICQRLEALLNVPIRIANDVDCMAFAEFQNTGKSFSNNLTYIGFDEGVKVSMFLNGQLYKGSFGNAGLIISHLLNVNNQTISLEDQKRIMTISGLNQIFEQKVAELKISEKQVYEQILSHSYRHRLKLILLGAQQDLPVCVYISNMLNAVLTTAIVNIIYVIQPDSVVIGGLLSDMPAELFTELSQQIRSQLPPLFANNTDIEQSQLSSSNTAALGANYHFLEWFVSNESIINIADNNRVLPSKN